MYKMVGPVKLIKNIGKGIYAVSFAFFESITISFYENTKKRWSGPSKGFKEVKVPEGYRDSKLEPEFKDLTQSTYINQQTNDTTEAYRFK